MENFSDQLANKRWYVKIVAGRQQAMAETVYYNKGFPFKVFMKWKWYFHYREALVRIQKPQFFIELQHGSYDYTPTHEENEKNLRNKIINKKGKVTELERKIKYVEDNWNLLFPLAEEPKYKAAQAKLAMVKRELIEMEHEYKVLTQQ